MNPGVLGLVFVLNFMALTSGLGLLGSGCGPAFYSLKQSLFLLLFSFLFFIFFCFGGGI